MANELPSPTTLPIVPPTAGPGSAPDGGSQPLIIHGAPAAAADTDGGDVIFQWGNMKGQGTGRDGHFVFDTDAPTADPSFTGALFIDGDGHIGVSGQTKKTVFGNTGTVLSGNVVAGTPQTSALAITGAALGMIVEVTPDANPANGLVWGGYVSSAGTVTVVLNSTAGTIAATGRVYHVSARSPFAST